MILDLKTKTKTNNNKKKQIEVEKEMAAHSSILAGKPHRERSLAGGYVKESDMT